MVFDQFLMIFQICCLLKNLQNWPNNIPQHLESLKLLLPNPFLALIFLILKMTYVEVGRVHDLGQQRSAELSGVDNSP